MNIFFILLLALSSSNHWERYSHPRPEILYKELSQSLREDTRVNFITLQTSKYSFNFMKETIRNNSLIKENRFLEKKIMNRRKIDIMFSRHKRMITNIHKKSEQNLYTLETIRKRVSDELSNLKRSHLTMVNRLIQNHKEVEDIYDDKKQNHMNTIEEKYKEWKNKREEILETIESL